jgi:hypothetical protein
MHGEGMKTSVAYIHVAGVTDKQGFMLPFHHDMFITD